jgi:hypothetical protein
MADTVSENGVNSDSVGFGRFGPETTTRGGRRAKRIASLTYAIPPVTCPGVHEGKCFAGLFPTSECFYAYG